MPMLSKKKSTTRKSKSSTAAVPKPKTASSPKSSTEVERAGEFSAPKKPVLTERRKFHDFFRDVYLKEIDLNSPHHADKHGMLGYENNLLKYEIQGQNGYEEVEVKGLCEYCSQSQPSAKDLWEAQK